jgi:hypothetical protein
MTIPMTIDGIPERQPNCVIMSHKRINVNSPLGMTVISERFPAASLRATGKGKRAVSMVDLEALSRSCLIDSA